jgi:hypothetical protein
MDESKAFHIGLCMAGAISAGAYTAGVVDYLIEALDEWEARRNEPGVPTHRVMISAIGGASAGGMTALMTAAAINFPIGKVSLDPNDLLKEQPQNPFYHSWVDMTRQDMFTEMLNTADLKEKQVFSLFNGSFIDQIANNALRSDPDTWYKRNYFPDDLKVFCTLTNLEGFKALIPFTSSSGTQDYIVNTHNDYGCFVLNPSKEVLSPGWIPLSFKDNINTTIAKEAAIATGAFPIALKARRVSRPKKYIDQLSWLTDQVVGSDLVDEPYKTLNVDGGLINNEPFERVRQILSEVTGQTDPKTINNYDTNKSTVLMIDPFPSELEKFDADDHLLKVLGSTFSAMLSQLRIKPKDLIDAMNLELAGQYLIAPTRSIPDHQGVYTTAEGSKAIAGGAFGGFAGFISKEFRTHDYLLGRANCEKFLLDHFTVPADASNEIFLKGYLNADKSRFCSLTNGGLQIIPIFKKRINPFPLAKFSSGQDWPAIKEKELRRYQPLVRKRVQSIVLNASSFDALTKLLLWIGLKVVITRKITDWVLGSIRKSLREHNLFG